MAFLLKSKLLARLIALAAGLVVGSLFALPSTVLANQNQDIENSSAQPPSNLDISKPMPLWRTAPDGNPQAELAKTGPTRTGPKRTGPKQTLVAPPRILLYSASGMVGEAGTCFKRRLEDYQAEVGVLALCGAASRAFELGEKYACPFAKARGSFFTDYLAKYSPFGTAFTSKQSSRMDPIPLLANSGDLLISDSIRRLKPDLIGFVLGNNESAYKSTRLNGSASAIKTYREKLRLYHHADDLVDVLPKAQACFYVSPTWVSKESQRYGKSNDEAALVSDTIRLETQNRCTFISGTQIMSQSEVKTSDGLHLNKPEACLFGTRIADRLIDATPHLGWRLVSAPIAKTKKAASQLSRKQPIAIR